MPRPAALPVRVEGGGTVRFGGRFAVTFQRTLRVPETGEHPLPPSLGLFPVLRVEDHADAVPPAWREAGGVFLPVRRREALWLGFRGEEWHPHAVKVGVGGINAVTGEAWTEEIGPGAQDYLVCPPQLWLDGVVAGEARVRQFVAAPLGAGHTVEGQLTGREGVGGLQFVVFAPRPGRFPGAPPPEAAPKPAGMGPAGGGMGAPPGAQAQAAPGMGVAAGGWMRQKVYPDPYGPETWDPASRAVLRVHLADAEAFRAITGREPPPTPVDARAYAEAGLPWFELYDDDDAHLPASERLGEVRPLGEVDPSPDDDPGGGPPPRVVPLTPPKRR